MFNLSVGENLTGIDLLTYDTLPGHIFQKYDRDVPHIIKYMGSKRSILDFVIESIDQTYTSGKLYDIFGGTNILSGALGKLIPIHANDIQVYSSVLANTYLASYNWEKYSENILDDIIKKASDYVSYSIRKYPEFSFSYTDDKTLEAFVKMEQQQQMLINHDFSDLSHHLFLKYYSGTYWSHEQCLWIDGLRKTADDYLDTPIYYVILSSLMFAMSYNSQSTGHYAQFRDANTASSQTDILIYRQKQILPYFISKFKQLQLFLGANSLNHSVSSLDFSVCLDEMEPESLVYADPPYAFVHYSRFYHALETLVKYDYPEVNHKGRYRTDRHQSPFCKRTEVFNAFSLMFKKVQEKGSNLILSYSNTGMISLPDILRLASDFMGPKYKVTVREVAYKHSTMGRKDDRTKNVSEYLIIAQNR